MGRKHILWHYQHRWDESCRTHEHVQCLVDARRDCCFGHHPACESTRKSKFLPTHKYTFLDTGRTLPASCSRIFKSKLAHLANKKGSDWLDSFTGWESKGFVVLLGFLQVRFNTINTMTRVHFWLTTRPSSRLCTPSKGARPRLK